MDRRHPAVIAALGLALGVALAACGGSGSDDVRVTTPTVSTGAEATFGVIDRFPGGTAVVTSPHTLVAIACDATTLTLTTTAATFTGTMDCTAMPPSEIIDRYIDKAIAITIGRGRLKIENPDAGSLDLPATDVTS